tara:strand:+ start:1355 stop:1573 length:219 start_codon:yes stop_codon:yes gene_type:complete
MYRIVKETNVLTGRQVYYIEERKTWLWMTNWTREISVKGVTGKVASLTLHGIKHKLKEVMKGGNMIKTEVID